MLFTTMKYKFAALLVLAGAVVATAAAPTPATGLEIYDFIDEIVTSDRVMTPKDEAAVVFADNDDDIETDWADIVPVAATEDSAPG